MLHFDPSQRIRNGPCTTRTRGESARLVLHCDAEGPGKNGAVDTGHDECDGQGKGSRGDDPSAVSNSKRRRRCSLVSRRAGISQRTTGMGKNLGRGSFRVGEGKIAYKLKKAQNGEPHLRLPCGVNSDGHAALARNAQTEVNQACPPPLRCGNCSAMPCAAATWQDKGLMSCRNWKRRRKKTWRN